MPSIHCPHCDSILTVPEAALGKNGRCAGCRKSFVVQFDPPPDAAEDGFEMIDDEPAGPAVVAPVGKVDRGRADHKPEADRTDARRDRPDKPRRKGSGKKKRSAAVRPGLPRWVWAAGGGGVLLLLGLIGLLWLVFGGGGGGGGDSDSLAREPKANLNPGNPSTIYPHEFPAADPQTWKVAVEAADPPPAGLQSVIAAPAGAFVPREAPAGRVGRKQPVAVGSDPPFVA